MARIVLIHGINQEQEGADRLEELWLPALASGVRRAGYPEIADLLWRDRHSAGAIDARMAFYGHLFLKPGQQGSIPGELDGDQVKFADQLAELWLRRAADRASNLKEKTTASRELAYVTNTVGVEEQGIRSGLRVVAKSLAKLRFFAKLGMGIAEKLVNRSLIQVTLYMADDSIRTKAQDIVRAVVSSNTEIIVGHSLGSVIAYEVAHFLDRPLPLLLTIGSPLGLDTIIYPLLRPQPPIFPPKVVRWVNIADRDDFVAAEPDLTSFFSGGLPRQGRFEGAYTVDNGADPHSALFYLTKAMTGRPIGQVLSGM